MGGLFGSAVLDVALGLVFIYLLLSIICTAANEWIAGVSGWRANLLRKSIQHLFGSQPAVYGKTADAKGATKEPTPKNGFFKRLYSTLRAWLRLPSAAPPEDGFFRQFYSHPLVSGMKRGKSDPAYLSARVFAKVVMDLVTPDTQGRLTFTAFQRGVRDMDEGDVKTALLALIQDTDKELNSVRRAIEGWFEDKMDRATGWYKRRTQLWTVVVAVCITAAANADTLRMSRRLWNSPEVRAAFVEEAKSRAQQPRPSVSVEYPDPDNPDNPVVTNLDSDIISERERALLGQVLGWQTDAPDEPSNPWVRWPQRLLGWLITVLAVSLGAPFWFDLLNKFVHIRAAGKSPDEAAKRPEKKKLPPEDKTA